MSLDIRITSRKKLVCPHCNKFCGEEDVEVVECGGSGWHPILEEIGYYVPYDKRTEENNWYGKDMELTKGQTKQLYDFSKVQCELYNAHQVCNLIACSVMDGNVVVVNADW